MKKMFYLLGLCGLSMLLLIGCMNKNEEPIARENDLEEATFGSNRYQLTISDGKLFVMGNVVVGEKHIFDEIIFEENEPVVPSVSMVFEDVKIKTKGSEYFITADGISFKMKKFMNHIVKDELGNEYIIKKL